MAHALRWLALALYYRDHGDPRMSLLLTLLGVLSAALSHVSLVRHQAPAGWGYLYALYEVAVPAALAVALAHPPARDVAVALAAALSVLVAVLSLVVLWTHREAQAELANDVAVGRAVRRAARRQWSVDLDGQIRGLQRRTHGQTPEA
jgi:hypothetical protein